MTNELHQMPELEPILRERARLAAACSLALRAEQPDPVRIAAAEGELLRQLRLSGWVAVYVEPSSHWLNGGRALDVYSREVEGFPTWLNVNCATGVVLEM